MFKFTTHKIIEWNESKNNWLKKNRSISFEEVVVVIVQEGIIDRFKNPNKEKYPNQEVFAICYNNYIYLIPFIEDPYKYFLKTIIASRKATKKYLKK